VWRVNPVGSYYDTRWLTGLWSTQVKEESIVLKAAWHWVSDNSVVNDPLGEPSRSPFYVGSVDGDYMFSSHFLGGLLFGTPTDTNE